MISNSHLLERSSSACELCGSAEDPEDRVIAPKTGASDDERVVLCAHCRKQMDQADAMDPNHWRCLSNSIWSPVPAVQVLSWRILRQMADQDWAADLLGQIYLDEATMEWAQANEENILHQDSNGNTLQNGDTVTLIQDLPVKGANFTAKRGTAVRGIRLVPDNREQIEGKVNEQHIVILTRYVRKA
jgi:protein PhnA